jgi:hypothetical protein
MGHISCELNHGLLPFEQVRLATVVVKGSYKIYAIMAESREVVGGSLDYEKKNRKVEWL